MQLFYTKNFTDKNCTLSNEECIHCKNVLRKKVGESILVTDGKGNVFNCSILAYKQKECILSIDNLISFKEKHNYNLHIAIAPTKNIDRTEWFVEKAVEVGVNQITPIICERSERKIIRQDRLEKIAISAMKQSTNIYMPIINEPVNLSQFLEKTDSSNKFIAHCLNQEDKSLFKNSITSSDILMLIGPEGDFSENEIKECISKGFKPVSLGESRLRTETAALATCFTVSLHYM